MPPMNSVIVPTYVIEPQYITLTGGVSPNILQGQVVTWSSAYVATVVLPTDYTPVMSLAICIEPGVADNARGLFLQYGLFTSATGLTAGNQVYLSDTGYYAASPSSHVIYYLGTAQSATSFLFNPAPFAIFL